MQHDKSLRFPSQAISVRGLEVLFLTALLSLTAQFAHAQSASLVATYNFQNTLNAAQGSAPAMVAANPRGSNAFVTDMVLGRTMTVYEVSSLNPSQNAGLSLNTTNMLNPNAYSIEMLFTFTERPGTWRRVLENQNRISDRGLYVNPSNQFEFSALSRGSAVTANGQYIHMVLSVADSRVRLYVNGNEDINLSTTSMNLTTVDPSTMQRSLNIFLDNDVAPSTSDFASARIALLRAYTNALTLNEARELAANPFGASIGVGAPSFLTSGVRNGATFSESTPIAPGAFFSLLGSSLSEGTSDWGRSFQEGNAPTTLNGTRVLINDRPAFLSYTSPGQLNAIAPDDLSPGSVSIVVERGGVRSAPVTAQARALNPAFFTYDQRQRRFIAALAADNSAYIAPADLFGVPTVNGLAVRPSRPGDFVVAYGMGMGATNPSLPAGRIPPVREGGHPLAGSVQLRFGTQDVTPLYAGLSSFAGVHLVGFQVPDLPTGDYELQITINGVSSPTGVVIPLVR